MVLCCDFYEAHLWRSYNIIISLWTFFSSANCLSAQLIMIYEIIFNIGKRLVLRPHFFSSKKVLQFGAILCRTMTQLPIHHFMACLHWSTLQILQLMGQRQTRLHVEWRMTRIFNDPTRAHHLKKYIFFDLLHSFLQWIPVMWIDWWWSKKKL